MHYVLGMCLSECVQNFDTDYEAVMMSFIDLLIDLDPRKSNDMCFKGEHSSPRCLERP